MTRSHLRCALTFSICAVCSCDRGEDGPHTLSQAATVIVEPVASDLEVQGHGPEANALIEHYALENSVSFQFRFIRGVCSSSSDTCIGGADAGDPCFSNADCASGPLSFVSGETELFDGDGNSLGTSSFDAATFDEATSLSNIGICNADATIACSGPGGDDEDKCGAVDPACNSRPAAGYVPDHANYLLRNPNELVAHNLVPAEAEIRICFAEFQTMSGCDLLQVQQSVEEYRVPPGQTYIFPLGVPDQVGEQLWNNEAHEYFSHHRGPNNQRHAYDVLSLIGGDTELGTFCDSGTCSGGAKDGDSCSEDIDCSDNRNTFIYEEPLLAMADGVVVALTQGYPENPNPPEKLPGVNGCDVTACGNASSCSGNDVPTTGNSIFIEHDNGEISMMAHTIPGSTDHLSCGSTVVQGEQIGLTGNSGNSTDPHLHFATQKLAEFWDSANYSFPSYYINVAFAAGPDPTIRRQLDVGLRSFFAYDIWPVPGPIAMNAAAGPGDVGEDEPNDTLSQHNALLLPAQVSATLENSDVGDLAVRGDGIEDVYRFALDASDELRVELASDSGENLDLYALTEDLRVLNETHQGTSPTADEAVCLELGAGAYYLMVSNVDPTQSADADYTLGVSSDPQTIAATITNAEQPIEVDESCEARVDFSVTIHDTCCLDADNLGLSVEAGVVGNNATLGPVTIDSVTAQGPRDIEVVGHVMVSTLQSCPAQVVISATAQDCLGNLVTTDEQGTSASTLVIDTIAPVVVESSADLYCLWPPNHEYQCFDASQFDPQITDNCAPSPSWQFESCSSNQPDNGLGDGNTVNDCVLDDDAQGFCSRSERMGKDPAGRRYDLGISATDQCGNVSPETSIGNIYVPHDQSPQLSCIAPGDGTALGD